MTLDHQTRPFLSVCIPTYQGAAFLRESLDSIVRELAKVSEPVEIVISDNGSTDHTEDIVREFMAAYPNISYFKSPENLGLDWNIRICIEHATGQYIHMFSDDDVIDKDGFYQAMGAMLRQYSPAIAAAGLFSFKGNYKKRKSNMNVYDVEVVQSGREFFMCFGGFIGTLIFRSDLAKELVKDLKKGVENDTGSGHLYISSRIALTSPPPFTYLPNAWVASRNLPETNPNFMLYSFVYPMRIVQGVYQDKLIDRETYYFLKKRVIRTVMWRRMWGFLVTNDHRHLFRQRHEFVQMFGDCLSFYVLVYPLFFIPRPLLLVPYMIGKKILNVSRWLRRELA